MYLIGINGLVQISIRADCIINNFTKNRKLKSSIFKKLLKNIFHDGKMDWKYLMYQEEKTSELKLPKLIYFPKYLDQKLTL